MTDRTHPDSARITTSSDVIADLHDEIARLERELSQALAAADVEAREADRLRLQMAQREPLTADDLREPKNGANWRVEWWNESARLMLPANKRLDSFQSYKNGTLMFTLKEHGTQPAHKEQA